MGVGNEGFGWELVRILQTQDCRLLQPLGDFFPLNSAVVGPGEEQRSGKQNRARVGSALGLEDGQSRRVCTGPCELQRVFEAIVHSTQNGEEELMEGLGSSASLGDLFLE